MACTDYTRIRSVHSMSFLAARGLDSSVLSIFLASTITRSIVCLVSLFVPLISFKIVLTFKLFNWLSNLNYFVGLNGSQNCLTVVTNMNSSYDLVGCNLNKHNFIQLLLLDTRQNRGECASSVFSISSPSSSSSSANNYEYVRTYILT